HRRSLGDRNRQGNLVSLTGHDGRGYSRNTNGTIESGVGTMTSCTKTVKRRVGTSVGWIVSITTENDPGQKNQAIKAEDFRFCFHLVQDYNYTCGERGAGVTITGKLESSIGIAKIQESGISQSVFFVTRPEKNRSQTNLVGERSGFSDI